MPPDEWDETRTDAARFDRLVILTDAPDGPRRPHTVLAGVAVGERPVLVRPRKLGAFLRACPRAALVAADAAPAFRAVERRSRAEGDEAAHRAL